MNTNVPNRVPIYPLQTCTDLFKASFTHNDAWCKQTFDTFWLLAAAKKGGRESRVLLLLQQAPEVTKPEVALAQKKKPEMFKA